MIKQILIIALAFLAGDFVRTLLYRGENKISPVQMLEVIKNRVLSYGVSPNTLKNDVVKIGAFSVVFYFVLKIFKLL